MMALASAAPPTNPPPLPTQWSATFTTSAGVTVQQFSDSSKQAYATFSSTGAIVVADCIAKLTYSNSDAFGQVGVCTLKPPDPYFDATCPSTYAPTWPPAAGDFYAGYKNLVTYDKTMDCPSTANEKCDRYYHETDKNTFVFYVVASTALPDSGAITYAGVTYTHTFLGATVDPAKLGRPAGCPNPDAPGCAICFTGQCAPCQACVGQAHTGQCAPCWDDSASGFACMDTDVSKDLCTECWKPSNDPPAPAPTPVGPADTCGGSCSDLGIVGQCCPTAKGSWLDCCDHSAACSANPECAAEGIEGDCCPTKTGTNLGCCSGGPPNPTTPTPAGDPCVTGPCGPSGECNACKACLNTQAGPCAPCWEKTAAGTACLPDCNDNCWHTNTKTAEDVKALKVLQELASIKSQIF